MNKRLKNILIIIGIVIVFMAIYIGYSIYSFFDQKYDTSHMSPYYQELVKECETRKSFSCCIASVEDMAAGGYKLALEPGCPEGYQRTMLRCMNSFAWCEPQASL